MLDIISTVLILILTVILYHYLQKNANYWKDKNVPHMPPIPIFGNLKSLMLLRRSLGDFVADFYNSAEAQNQKYIGIYLFNNKPALVVRDPELIKNILVKDFNNFLSRSLECDENNDPIGANNLFVIRGAKWKYLRSHMSPAFTSAKVKPMYDLIKNVSRNMVEFIEEKSEKFSTILETKNAFTRLTIDIISIAAFGLQSNTVKMADSRLKYFGDKIFDMTIKRSFELRSFFFLHPLVKTFKCVFLQKESTEFLKNFFGGVIQEREEKNIYRNDLVDILIKMKNQEEHKMDEKIEGANDEILEFKESMMLSQPVFFFTAGFETSSTTISMALYELALQQDIQEKLRKEITEKFKSNNDDISYEGLFEMKYLNMVVLETLRKYPPMPFLDRLCTIDYKIPDSDVIIEKGTPIFIPLFRGIHYDENQFPQPEKFDPERFDEENQKRFHPFSFLPFGDGPHMCVGRRFGLMSVKTGLTFILKNFRVETCEKTEIPLKIDNRAFIVTAKNGVYLKFVKI